MLGSTNSKTKSLSVFVGTVTSSLFLRYHISTHILKIKHKPPLTPIIYFDSLNVI